jgi:glycosyltransferase involved in cell wall biosynthesis
MRVAICAPILGMGGGQLMIVRYANHLSEQGHDVTLILEEVWIAEVLSTMIRSDVTISSSKIAMAEKNITYDLAIGTYWKTYTTLFQIRATAYCQFIQSLECRFFDSSDPRSVNLARIVQELDVPAIVVADWIADSLTHSSRRSRVTTVLNGIDKNVYPISVPREVNPGQRLKVVIEGSESGFKGFLESAKGVAGVSIPIDLSIFSVTGSFPAEALTSLQSNPLINLEIHGAVSQTDFYSHLCKADILVKSSRVEGMPGPPLEAFHAGCTGIYTDVTGIESYAEHGVNAIIVPFDSTISITNWIETLDSNRNLLQHLQNNAISTAEKWKTAESSSKDFENALMQCYDDYVSNFSSDYVNQHVLPILFDAITHERHDKSYGVDELNQLRMNQVNDIYYLDSNVAKRYAEHLENEAT